MSDNGNTRYDLSENGVFTLSLFYAAASVQNDHILYEVAPSHKHKFELEVKYLDNTPLW